MSSYRKTLKFIPTFDSGEVAFLCVAVNVLIRRTNSFVLEGIFLRYFITMDSQSMPFVFNCCWTANSGLLAHIFTAKYATFLAYVCLFSVYLPVYLCEERIYCLYICSTLAATYTWTVLFCLCTVRVLPAFQVRRQCSPLSCCKNSKRGATDQRWEKPRPWDKTVVHQMEWKWKLFLGKNVVYPQSSDRG